MYKQVLNSINNIEIYPIITLIIFVVFFFAMIGYVMSMKKDTVAHLAHLPLEDEASTINPENAA